ncbi:ferredoxin [Thecamonas trahens ATCC 50062]|uniref:Ferredoxin n=1 Tax=Thecamonas trahens ATCC 50062 TaxID=461836 RepID=A0A0L0DMW7_THETB|nr:ferredoxin [Thecamonas trahens ATCC 50062]KNC53595.1 ferredoxin [Thecamonas trahens ATCC 50062]|eukprot:XP_013761912.1 ferredoxin [Thecamonas trahens ATCC 50062]
MLWSAVVGVRMASRAAAVRAGGAVATRSASRATATADAGTVAVAGGVSAVRAFSASAFACTGSDPGWKGDGTVANVVFVTPEGEELAVEGENGQHLLAIAHDNGIELEGACEASLACSTCHVIVDDDFFDKLPEPEEEEEDMLDLAFGLTETSRLGCQIVMSPDIDGIRVTLPAATRNFAVDGFVPQPH